VEEKPLFLTSVKSKWYFAKTELRFLNLLMIKLSGGMEIVFGIGHLLKSSGEI
jgi:hypothetical protein